MALVHGWFCPLFTYACARTVDDSGYRCAEYARDRRCLAAPDLRRFCIDRHEWPNRVGEPPKVYVNFTEAKELCASAGKRLCRRSEWILACEGPKRLPYPWGYVRQPSPCNIDRSPVPVDAFALEAADSRDEELARLGQADPIGSHPDCVSAFGVYDMAGNVDEWTDNLADNPHTKRPSTLNGGYWGPVRDTCRLTTKSHGPRFRFYQVGFRCCRDPLDGMTDGPEGPVGPPAPWLDPDPPDDEAGGEYAPVPKRGAAGAGASSSHPGASLDPATAARGARVRGMGGA
jgi:sulfatase modifying factor 1